VVRSDEVALWGEPLVPTLSRPDSLALRQRAEVVALRRGTHFIDFDFEGQAVSDELFESIAALPVTVRERWGSVTAGRDHTCALTYEDPLQGYSTVYRTSLRGGGEAFCWGEGPDGALGTGNFNDLLPAELASDDRYVGIWAGFGQTCATDQRRRLFCWGQNEWGQLGTGNGLDQFFPTAVALGIPMAQVAVGDAFTCAFPVSLNDEAISSTTCWGANAEGQLGCDDGDPTEPCYLLDLAEPGDQLIPSEDVKSTFGDIFFDEIAAGARHACGLELDTRTAWCWGDNSYGQLGVDNGVADCRKLGAEPADTLEFPCSRSAVQVQGPSGGPLAFASLAAGDDFTCGMTLAGDVGEVNDVYCWGRNDVGQLGDGTRLDSSIPVRAVLAATDGFFQITAGGAHACAIAVDEVLEPDPILVGESPTALEGVSGKAYCWGANDNGQLGDGTTQTRDVPVAVSGGLSFTDLGAGSAHTCGVVSQPVLAPIPGDGGGGAGPVNTAVAFGGPIYCWGDNQAIDGELGGKLGTGSTDDSHVPVRVSEPSSADAAPTPSPGPSSRPGT
jgi:alpha-tubulin suppressor-like RCC1 family protein